MPSPTRPLIAAVAALACVALASPARAQWYPYPYPYPMYHGDAGAAVRLEVKPADAEVYVDGYYAGIVDDFDGMFQRLTAEPGEHEIQVYRDGYKMFRQRIYLQPNHTFKIRHALEKLGAGEPPERRPEPVNPPQGPGGQPPQPGPGGQPGMYPPPPQGRGPAGRPPQGGAPPPQRPDAPEPPRRPEEPPARGTLSIRVQPGDAEVLVDGEPWRTPENQDDYLVIQVSEGRHTIEIRKTGYRTYVTELQVRRGETTPVNVSLRTQE